MSRKDYVVAIETFGADKRRILRKLVREAVTSALRSSFVVVVDGDPDPDEGIRTLKSEADRIARELVPAPKRGWK